MNTLFVLLAVVVLLMAVGSLALAKKKGAGEKPRPKALMTEREQVMYNRLTQALPDLIVLAQVSFGALLSARSYAARNTFDRKVADFVICDKAFRVLAVVELDDSSHRGREKQDRAREALLRGAGYRIVRYPRVPDLRQVTDDFATPTPAGVPRTAEPTDIER